MDIPLYISIPFAVAFVHYDNHRRFWPWVWARIKRRHRNSTTGNPYWDRRYEYTRFRNRRECPPLPPPPGFSGAFSRAERDKRRREFGTIANLHVRNGRLSLPMGSPAIPDDDCSIQRGSDMLLSEMKPLIVPIDVHVENVPADVVLIRVANANPAKMARVAAHFRKWQEDCRR